MAELTKIQDAVLIWGTPGDIDLKSDGGGEYSSTFRLTPRGIATVALALGHGYFADGETCKCEKRREGDGIHVPGEMVDVICLATPLVPQPSTPEQPEGENRG